jgi:hypothetical protein
MAAVVVGLLACGGSTSSDLVWKGEQSPTTEWLFGVWASGDHDVYAVGMATIIHSTNDGGAWTLESSPAGSTTLWSVGGSSATDVYVVGDGGLILHGGGDGQWAEETSPVSTSLNHVWANAADDVYIVGDDGVILHGDGTGTWTVQSSGTTDRLWSVWASGSNAYAVGGKSGLTANESPAESLVLHSIDGGNTWTPEATPPGGRDLAAVWGTPGGVVLATGWDRILRSADGATWTEVPTAGALAMAALAGDASHVYAAGNGIVFRSDDEGASFQQVLGGFSVSGAWVIPRGDCYIVGVGSDGNGGPNAGAIGHGQ